MRAAMASSTSSQAQAKARMGHATTVPRTCSTECFKEVNKTALEKGECIQAKPANQTHSNLARL